MVFWAFCILSFCFRNISLSSSVIIICDGPEQKCTKLLHLILGLGPCTTRDPKSIHPASFYHLSGCKVEGRLMRVCDILRMELMAECLGKQPVFLVQERPWSPSSSTILPQRHFVLSKILAPVRRAIAIRSSSGLSKFPTLAIGNASDQAAVWLSCAASNQQWFQGLVVFSRELSVVIIFYLVPQFVAHLQTDITPQLQYIIAAQEKFTLTFIRERVGTTKEWLVKRLFFRKFVCIRWHIYHLF